MHWEKEAVVKGNLDIRLVKISIKFPNKHAQRIKGKYIKN
jgi:hypothetical protein